MQCNLCLPRETKLAAYKIWTSTLHKHVEVRSEASCPFKVRGHVPQIFEPSGFWMQLPKNSRIIFSIFDTITPAWLDRSMRLSSAAKFKSAFAGWHWARDRCVFTALRIITNHTRCCWAYECKDQSEVCRWVIDKMSVFSSLARWLNTSFWRILSLETTKCICVYESVSKIFIHRVNSFSDFNGRFWECLNSRLSVKMFFDNVNVLCSLSVQWKCYK